MGIRLEQLSIGYAQKKIQGPLDLEFHPGEFIAILGPNGSGKSTLLKTMSGWLNPMSGKILLEGKNVLDYSTRERAKKLAMVFTGKPSNEQLSVRDLVSIGRNPYTNWWGKLSSEDHRIIDEVLDLAQLKPLANRLLHSLSDGQRQRAIIAQALAQNAPYLLLDEPTAHLDLPHRVGILSMLKEFCVAQNKAVLISTHELDLALQVCDRIVLLDSQGKVHCDSPEHLALSGAFGEVFNSDKIQFSMEKGLFQLLHHHCAPIRLQGNPGPKLFWTERALNRMGFELSEKSKNKVEVMENHWICHVEGKEFLCHSFRELAVSLTGRIF